MLLVSAAIAALYAGVAGIIDLSNAQKQTQWYATRHGLGLLAFAGIFLLLAYRPYLYPGLWEIVLMNKAGLAVAWFFQRGADHASDAAVDVVLVVLIATAYVLERAWVGWAGLRRS